MFGMLIGGLELSSFPIILLLFFLLRKRLVEQGKAPSRLLGVLAWLILIFGLAATAVLWIGGGLSHLDCGNDCGPSVPSYAAIYTAVAIVGATWVAIGIWCLRVAKRYRNQAH
jgi:hypothetical protein